MPDHYQIYKQCRREFLFKLMRCIQSEENIKKAVKDRMTVRLENGEANFMDDLFNPGLVFDLSGNIEKASILEHGGEPGNSTEFYRIQGFSEPVYIDIGRINEALLSWFPSKIVQELSLWEKIIYDAVLAEALTAAKQNEEYLAFQANADAFMLNAEIDNLPASLFQKVGMPCFKLKYPCSWVFSPETLDAIRLYAIRNLNTEYNIYDLGCPALKHRVDLFPEVGLNAFENAVSDLNTLLIAHPSPKADRIANATVELLIDLDAFNEIEDAGIRAEKIRTVFQNYEVECKYTGAGQAFLKAVGVVIITGLCFTLGVTLSAAAFGLAGLAAGAWSGPGAAVSGMLGAFSGGLTGWTLATVASGTVLGALGLAGSSYGFFKESALDKTITQVIDSGLEQTNNALPQAV